MKTTNTETKVGSWRKTDVSLAISYALKGWEERSYKEQKYKREASNQLATMPVHITVTKE